MFQTFTSRLHLDFIQTSTLLQLLAKPELGTTPAPACHNYSSLERDAVKTEIYIVYFNLWPDPFLFTYTKVLPGLSDSDSNDETLEIFVCDQLLK